MHVTPLRAAAALAALLWPLAVPAQGLPDRTGTGGGPAATITAPNTSAVGRTKPPSGGSDAELDRGIQERTREERLNDRIDTGICIGCDK
ncbi:hypothetical protein OPKNFCMD_0243 [Methylobacterium crusticola]|uniref:Uncharacterized protein n=1 Tax=Methylobacterium crusticola TaxID=1697972 RepID=A0ABQ4QQG9_9HYPH|nr:hypothetical protein [Methylobacterium crusticola]GJD47535.1 hypothetical protein OPKNFCMD_0243 [Methylobacterium crusticola]